MFALAFPVSLFSAPIVVDDFEGFILSDDWDEPVVNSTIRSGIGAEGSSAYVQLTPTTGILGAIFEGGVSDFYVDFYLRIQPGRRQFNFMVMNHEEVSADGASVNLRFQNDVWSAFNGSWQPISLPGILVDGWYHLRITCRGWGSIGATYDIELSDFGGTEFTSSAIDLDLYQIGNPNIATAGAFSFVTKWDDNAGFDLDNVIVEAFFPDVPPEITDFEFDQDASKVSIHWKAFPGKEYSIFASTDLETWELIGVRTASGVEEVFEEEGVTAEFRFYRVEVQSEP